MLALIEQLKLGAMWDFPGGIHPPENKHQSNQTPIEPASIPFEVIIPVKQHIGQQGELLVQVGDTVQKGQPLTRADLSMIVPVHASTSGVVSAIEPRVIAHPSGLKDLCVVITPDNCDRWGEKHALTDYKSQEPTALIEHIRQAGIAGLGGAGFPTARKLQSAIAQTDLLIINAAECEPYITADDRLMQDYAQEVIEGVRILQWILKPSLCVIAIEDNKPEAIHALHHALGQYEGIMIRVIPTKYPSGGEKQLIKILTNKEVPSGGIPADIGVLVQNVGTAFAIKRAIIDGEPLIERVVTLTGNSMGKPGNVWARIGTPVEHLLQRFFYRPEKKQARLILGGPMMGFTLNDVMAPISKTSNCILAPKRKELPEHNAELSCIRCSSCADACPQSLLPQQLYWYSKSQDYDKCESYNLNDCIECGACAYVCPSEIPLVQYYRQAKAEIKQRKVDADKSDRAKQRFEAKKARVEREKAARAERFGQAAQTRQQSSQDSAAIAAAIARAKTVKLTPSSDVKPAVAAAIARAKAKQAQLSEAPSEQDASTQNAANDMAAKREARKAEARARKAQKAAMTVTESPQSSEPTDITDKPAAKNAAVAAAIARAKAKKAQQEQEQEQEQEQKVSSNHETDAKQAAVAAAVARAKARKAAQSQQPALETDTKSNDVNAADSKKSAVAAAVARAKARKAAQQASTVEAQLTSTETHTETDKPAEAEGLNQSPPSHAASVNAESADHPADAKKAAVAAAVARAKARKAAQQASTADAQLTSTETHAEADKPVEAEGLDESPPSHAASVNAESADHPADAKKAAVAAAIARAKARKAAQQKAQSSNSLEDDA